MNEGINPREVVTGLTVIHCKRESRYRVRFVSTFQGSKAYDYERVVTYENCATGTLWTRPLSEFCDGRFRLANGSM